MEQQEPETVRGVNIMRLRALHKKGFGNDKGSVMILIVVAIVALFAFAALVIDGAMLMATKNQLQAAADAAALAGASGRVAGAQTTATPPALRFASVNQALHALVKLLEDAE